MDSWIRKTQNKNNNPKSEHRTFLYIYVVWTRRQAKKRRQEWEQEHKVLVDLSIIAAVVLLVVIVGVFFLGFGFVLWELSQTFFNWFLIFWDSQTKALNTNSVWDLIWNCRWQTQSGIQRWTKEAGHNITVNAVLVAIVCLNIIETRFQWVNFEVCPGTLWRRTGHEPTPT